MRAFLALLSGLLLLPAAAARGDEAQPASSPTWTLAATLGEPKRIVRSVAFDERGTVLAAGTSDRTLHLYDATRLELLAQAQLPRSG